MTKQDFIATLNYKIFADLSDRQGVLDGIDNDTLEEMQRDIKSIIETTLKDYLVNKDND